jgi:hypothetical protein
MSGPCRPSSEQFAVALYQRLALEGRKWPAELISACFPASSPAYPSIKVSALPTLALCLCQVNAVMEGVSGDRRQ